MLQLKKSFHNSIEIIRPLLEHLDKGCGQGHYSKSCFVESSDGEDSFVVTELMGHPIHCASQACNSQLRLLRAGAVHYPALRTLLKQIYCARWSSALIDNVESDLSSVNSMLSLKQNLGLEDLASLLQYDELPSSSDQSDHSGTTFSTVQSHLEVEFVEIIAEFYAKLKEDPDYTCCSCQCLLLKKTLTHFNFSTEKFNSSTWMQLKNYLMEKDPQVSKKTLYICQYCRPILNANNIPGRCVLNGLYIDPLPKELSNLNTLENQLIQ